MAKSTQEKTISLLFSFFVFLTMNLPSIKLLYSSSIINLIAMGGLWIIGILRINYFNDVKFHFNHLQFNFLLSFTALWSFLLWKTVIIQPESFDMRALFQYVSVMLFTLAIAIFVQKSDYKYIFWLQAFWGGYIAFSELYGGIEKDLSLGQNYLTSGVAIAGTIVVILGYIFSKENKIKIKILLLPLLLLLLGGITTLSGRAPIMFSIAVPLILILFIMFFEKDMLRKSIFFIIFPLIFLGVLFLLIDNLPPTTIDRIFRIFISIEEEPRYAQYMNSLEIISSNLLGIGLTGQSLYGMNYPHNIFLEVIMAGGLLTVIPFLTLLFIAWKNIIKTAKNREVSLVWLSWSLYLFLTWNISFDLSSSYMLFSSIALYTVSSKKQVQF